MTENYTEKQKLDHLKVARKYLETVLKGSTVDDSWFAEIQDAMEYLDDAIEKMEDD